MAYTTIDKVAAWKDKRIMGADAASFTVVLPIIAYDAHQVFVMGKPVSLDRASFEVLSPCYVRDRGGVYIVMESKLKPIVGADPANFQAIGIAHGRDNHSAWFRDKKIRLGKGGELSSLRELASAFATDGRWLYFGTQQEKLPAQFSVDWSSARLHAFNDSEVNCPLLTLDDGAQVLVRQTFWPYWMALPGAAFDSLAPLDTPEHLYNKGYMRDATQVWYLNQVLPGVSPKDAHLIGGATVAVGREVYSGAHRTELQADDLCYVDTESVDGDHFHTGQTVVVIPTGQPASVVVTRTASTLDASAAVSTAFARVFGILFTVFDALLPIENSPYRILNRLGLKPPARTDDGTPNLPPIPLVTVPTCTVQLQPNGMVVVQPANGAQLMEPASGWYTLACRFWANERGRDERFLPYPALGHMLPRGDELLSEVLKASADEMLNLAAALLQRGADTEARVLTHQLVIGAKIFKKRELQEPLDPITLQRIANFPKALLSETHYRPIYYRFPVTTNLAVARHILKQDLLADPDWRIRLEMAGQIHAVMDATDQVAHFLQEVMPAVMARVDVEPIAAVRERLMMALEMALVSGQVRCTGGSYREFHYEQMLPIIEFCLQRGINTRFNRARLAETLWALERTDEGDRVAADLLAQVGEMAAMQGIYSERTRYRCHRIGLLAAKTRAAWRDARADVHGARARALEEAYAALLHHFGTQGVDAWDDMRALRQDIAEYREHVQAE